MTFTTDAQGDIAFNISESLANSVSTHFNDTCPAGAGQKRLRKRVLDDHDVQCITNSAQYALKYAASSGNDLQNTLLLFPTDFPSLRGPLVASINQLAKFIQNPPLFNPSVFSGGLIHAILAVFVGIAFTLWVNGPGTGITQNMIPYSDLENAASSASSGCPSLTFSWTSPTLSTTVVVGLSVLLSSFGSDFSLAWHLRRHGKWLSLLTCQHRPRLRGNRPRYLGG